MIWLGDSLKRVRAFPAEVKRSIGSALYDAQQSKKSPSAKPFHSVGSGIFEIAIRYDKNAFRVIYAVQIGDSIYVLHAFQKKSKHGIATPKKELDLITRRYRQALDMENEK